MMVAVKNMNRRVTAAGRPGMMLVEVSVAVALSTIVLGLVVTVAIALKQMDRRMQTRTVERQRQLELAELIRTDVRLAAEVVLPSEESLVVRSAEGRETRYEIASDGIRRTIQLPDGKTIGNDRFAIHFAEAWETQRDESGRRPLVMVTLRRQLADTSHAAKPIPFVAYAALGADVPAAGDHRDEQ
jgi:hypothetical protein